jgi:hypothetical protein
MLNCVPRDLMPDMGARSSQGGSDNRLQHVHHTPSTANDEQTDSRANVRMTFNQPL